LPVNVKQKTYRKRLILPLEYGKGYPYTSSSEANLSRAIGLNVQLQLLDVVFHITSQRVKVIIDGLGIATQISDHKALIGSQPGIFQLGDDAAGLKPGHRLITEGVEKALFRFVS
jgi:hypothetical protein